MICYIYNSLSVNCFNKYNKCHVSAFISCCLLQHRMKITKTKHGKKTLIKYSIRLPGGFHGFFGKSVEAHVLKRWSHGDPIQPFILVVESILHKNKYL